MVARRFPIRFDGWYVPISWSALLPPSSAWVEVREAELEARMGWAFRALVPRAHVRAAVPERLRTPSRGVHGWAGRWLVNGSSDGIVRIEIAPHARARVTGFPVKLSTLLVSVEDPEGLVAALGRREV